MNLLLIHPKEVVNAGNRTEALVRGRRAHHALNVLEKRPGDTVRVGVLREGRGAARVVEGSARADLKPGVVDEAAWLRLADFDLEPEPCPRLRMTLALPRPKVLPRVLRPAASFGLRRLDILGAARVKKSYLSSPRLARHQLEEELWLGCEQGKTSWLPEVFVHPELQGYLNESRDDSSHKLLFHPSASQHLEELQLSAHATYCLALGPEGGWLPDELEAFERAGFVAVSLGGPVLTSEAAVPAALAQLEMARRLQR